MDVKYVVKGQPGKTYADCQNFQVEGSGKGKCFGHEVVAQGSCNLFQKK